MAITDLQRVNPGDLITADFFNGLIAELTALAARVEELERDPTTPSAGVPILVRRQPTGDVRMGGLLTLIGRNFAPISNARVTFGGRTITEFGTGSSDTQLSFQVPTFTEERTVTATVSTAQGTSNALSGIRVVPRGDPLPGEVVIVPQTAELGEIAVGQTYTLEWLVRSLTRRPATYTISTVLTNAFPISAAGAWEDGIELSTDQATISFASPETVTARVTVPEGGLSATIALHAHASDALQRVSTPITLEVGDTPEVSSSKVLVFPIDPQPIFDPEGEANQIRLVDGVIQVVHNYTGSVMVKVQPTDEERRGGRYVFTAEVEDDQGELWVVGDVDPGDQNIDAGEDLAIAVQLTNRGTAVQPAGETFLKVSAKRQDVGERSPQYVSFARIPIRSGE